MFWVVGWSSVYITPYELLVVDVHGMVDWVMFWVVNRPEFRTSNRLWVEDWSRFWMVDVYGLWVVDRFRF